MRGSLIFALGCALPALAAACDSFSQRADDDSGELAPEPAATTANDAGIQPAPPCNSPTWVRQDSDGDGWGSGEAQKICEGTAIPDGFVAGDPDCDDSDPSVQVELCVDEDGDGAVTSGCFGDPAPDGAHSCPYIIEWTPEPGPYDCDDSDPERIDWFYVDADGDGWGSGDAVCSQPSDGWSAWHGDCDDADGDVSPAALEYFEDGVDSDCDGADGSACGSLEYVDWPAASGTCDGVDLALGVISCSSCFVAFATLAVENRGSEVFEGAIAITGGIELTLTLAPGDMQLIASGPFFESYALELVGQTDCDPTNNATYVSHGHCI